MENLSLFMSGHGGSTNRTFIVEDYPEDEYGQWATDEVTGENAFLMMGDRVFGHGTTTSMLGSPESFRIVKPKEEKVNEKVKAKVYSKEQSLVVFLKVILVPIIQKRVQAKNITLTKEEVRIRREKEKTAPGTWTPCNDKEELGQ